MGKVRVPVANTVGKSVLIETDTPALIEAAQGATVGVDFMLPDGSVPSLEELASVLQSEQEQAQQWPFTFWNRIIEVPAVLASLGELTDPDENAVLYWDDVANALDFADNLHIDEAANLVSIRSGNTLRILDVGNTDSVSFSHDGVDFNIAGVLTTDINITGITSIQAGTVDADFDAITATTYGGILEANLLDKTAPETISSTWTFSQTLGGALQAPILLSSGLPGWILQETDGAANNKIWQFYAAGEDLYFDITTDAGAGTNWLKVSRTAGTVDAISLSATSIAITGALTATSYGGILEANLLDKTAAEEITAVWHFNDVATRWSANEIFPGTASNDGFIYHSNASGLTIYGEGSSFDLTLANKAGTATIQIATGTTDVNFPGRILTALGSESAPSRSFIGDTDTGDYSPGANIYAITVGGTEAIRWTGASAALMRHSMTTGITASTTQSQGESPLTGSWNEVSTVANKNDVVTLPSLTEGEMCLIMNTGTKDLQVFPFLGEDIGAGINNSLKIKKNSSRYWMCYDTNTTSFDIATDFLKLQGIELDGASNDDLLFRSGGDWTHTDGDLTWDGVTLKAVRLKLVKYLQHRTASTANLEDITNAVNTSGGKVQGAEVYNRDTDNPVYAVGNADGSVWVNGIGTTVHTPV